MNAICDDLDMKYLGFFSAAMYDLMSRKGREKWILFAAEFFDGVQNRVPTTKKYYPILDRPLDYVPGSSGQKVSIQGKKVLILSDLKEPNTNLERMIGQFKNSFMEEIKVINLHQIDIKGGCLGCFQCGYDYQCAYGDQDEYVQFYKDHVKPADILLFAGTIQDRYLSSRWKMFFDRSFFNTHTPSLTGKQVGFIVSGPLRQISNLRQILEAYTEWQQANLVDIIKDEEEDSKVLDARLHHLAEQVIHFAEKNYIASDPSLDIVFRDNYWFDEDARRIGVAHSVKHLSFWDQFLFYGQLQVEAFFCRREVAKKALPFDTTLRVYTDYSYFLPVRYGAKCKWVPQRLGAFRVHANQMHKTNIEKGKKERELLKQQTRDRLGMSLKEFKDLRRRHLMHYYFFQRFYPKFISGLRYSLRQMSGDYRRKRLARFFFGEWLVSPVLTQTNLDSAAINMEDKEYIER